MKIIKIIVIAGGFLASMMLDGCYKQSIPTTQMGMSRTRLQESSGLVSIKIRDVDKRPFIPVFLNRISNVMLIDTGAANTLILPEAASRSLLRKRIISKLEIEKSEHIDLAGRDAVHAGDEEYIADSLEIGELIINDTPLVKQKDTPKKNIIANLKCAGIIGLNTLELCGLMIDINNKKALVTWNGNLNSSERESLGFTSQNSYLLTLKEKTTTKHTIPVLLNNNVRLPMIIDTGSNRTVITESWYKKYIGKLPPVTKRTSETGWGKSQVRIFTANLKIGSMLFSNIEMGVVADKVLPYDGILGMDVLSQKRFLVDYPAGKIYFSDLSASNLRSLDQKLESIIHAPKQ